MSNQENETSSIENGLSYDVTITALQLRTRVILSSLLNPPKIILTNGGLLRDWQGLAQLMGIPNEQIQSFCQDVDPTQKVLCLWFEKNVEDATISKLLVYLEKMDRFDVFEDLKSNIDEDIMKYKLNHKTDESFYHEMDVDILTRDDLKRKREGLLGPQKYDAFVLFTDDDIDFATQLIDKMESQYKLKLCVKDRDLVVDLFRSENVITLITERCSKIVVIISAAFLESSANRFFRNFTKTVEFGQLQPKVIPCLYTACQLPYELSCYTVFDYRRAGKLWDFWERLRNSIKPPNNLRHCKSNIYRSASQRIPPSLEVSKIEPILETESNCLIPKKGVKFSSMINLSYLENDISINNDNLITNSENSLPKAKSKSKTGWLKKLLSHKNQKCSNAFQDVQDNHKKGFWSKTVKRKAALAN